MKRPDFEEKTYEKYFGWELLRHTKGAYSPGQCYEHYLGFDDGFFVRPWFLWRYRFLFPDWWARRYPGMKISEIDQIAAQVSRSLPEFRFNIFVQYKRPVYLCGHGSREWKDWKRPYFRYGITPHQQIALDGVHLASRGRAAVIYAAPVFMDSTILYRHFGSRNIIANSNIVSVHELTDHSRYTYVYPGGGGKVHSDQEEVRSASFQDIMQSVSEQDGSGFYDHVVQTARFIEAGVQGYEEARMLLEIVRREFFSVGGVVEAEVEAAGFIYALCTIFAFVDAFNTNIFMIANVESERGAQAPRSDG